MRTLCLVGAICALIACDRPQPPQPDPTPSATDLTMQVPVPAAWRAAETITARGIAPGLTGLEVNGAAATRSGAAWTAEVPLARGVNVVEVRGTDATGHSVFLRHGVLAGDFVDPTTPIGEALVVRVNEGGLDTALDAVGERLDADDLNEAIANANPVYEDSYGILGWNAVTVSADIGALWFDPPQLSADPRKGAIDVEIEVPALDVWVPVSGDVVGLDFDVDVWMWCELAQVDGTLTVDVEDGRLVAALSDPTVSLIGFDFDSSLLPGGVESWLLVDTVRAALEAALVEKLSLLVPELLDEQLTGLDLSFQADLLGTPVDVGADFIGVAIDEEGLQLAADVQVDAPASGLHTWKGALRAPQRPAIPSRHADVALSVSDDLLNLILFEVWDAGVLDLRLSTGDGSLDPLLLHPLGAGDEATIRVEPHLPPVVVEHDGALQLQISELIVTVATPGGEHGEHIQAACTLMVDLAIEVRGDQLVLDLGRTEVSLQVRANDWHVSNETLTNALAEALPVDVLLGLIDGFEMPLPTLGGIAIGSTEMSRDISGVHSNLELALH